MMITTEQKRKIEDAVRSAGKMIMNVQVREADIKKKYGPANFVTDYDVKIQKYLITALDNIVPGCYFFGEEDTVDNQKSIGAGYTFFIDPIDGTTNFIFGYHNSCVSVGLAFDGEIVSGWVYNPYIDQMWIGEKGKGACLNNRPIKITDVGLEKGICAFGAARYNKGDIIFSILPELFERSLSIRNGGSAAIDLCRIASGSNVGYVEMKLQPYDYAAASVIIAEAGGVIEQTDGKAIVLNTGCSIVAGTKTAVREIQEMISNAKRN